MNHIYVFYYKTKCNCKAKYHLNCIKEWFKYNNICPICKKEDNTNIDKINRIINRFYEICILFFILLSLLFLVLFVRYYK